MKQMGEVQRSLNGASSFNMENTRKTQSLLKLTMLWLSAEHLKHETVSILTKQEKGKDGGAYKLHI